MADFDYEAARKAGASDEQIAKFLSEKHDFNLEDAKKSGASLSQINKFLFSNKKEVGQSRPKKQEPLTLKGSAGSYAAGAGGGAGGLIPDVLNMAENSASWIPGMGGLRLAGKAGKAAGIKGTHELTSGIRSELGLEEEPQNALERILQQSGEFGGQEALMGAGLGGAVGAGAAVLHGSASGALYGGLKELGMDDEWALGITALTTVSPIAAKKLWPKLVEKFKSGSSFKEGMKAAEHEMGGKPPPEPPGGASGSLVVPTGRSGFELAEEGLEGLQKPEFETGAKLGRNPESKPFEVNFPSLNEETKPLTGRTKVLQEETASVISPEKFYNEKHGGTNISGLAKKELEKSNKIVRNKYKAAEKEYAGKNDIFPEIAHKIEETRQSLSKTAEPSTAEKLVLKQLESLQKIIGYPEALREVGLDRLIKTADSMSQLLNYEVVGGGVKNILKGFVKDLNKSVIASLERQGSKATLLKDADKAYAQMADRFFNDEIKGFLEKKIRNPESLYRKALEDEGTYRAVREALGPKNSKSLAKLERGIVEEAIAPYLKDPSKIGSKEYSQGMANLEGLIGKEKTAKVKSMMERKKVMTPPKKSLKADQNLRKEKVSSSTSLNASKYLGKTPEQIESMMNTRSGIKELRNDLNKKGLSKLFDQMAEEKMVSMMRGGDVAKKKITHADLYSEFNLNKNNYDVLVGLYEKPAADQFLEAIAKAYQKDKLKRIGIETIKVIARLLGAGKLVKIGSVLSKGL
jgi:hypothetical protein